MTRRRRGLLASAGAVALGVGMVFALRAMPFFQVRQVELVGARYVAPERVLEALALSPGHNVFDRVGPVRRRVERMPGVLGARVDRRLPGTLRVTVVERVPVAFVSGPDGMIPLDCDARPLPYDPSRGGLDLPLVDRADRVVIGTLCIVRAADSSLYGAVDLAHRSGAEAVTLNLASQRVIVRSYPTMDEITAVGFVRRHVAGADAAVAEIDARFAGWIVARRVRT